MKINTRNFLLIGLLAVCILSKTISTSTSGSASSSVSVDSSANLLSGLGSNLGISTLINAPLNIVNNLPLSLSTAPVTNTADSLLNAGATVDPNALLSTVGGVTSTASNLLGSATSTSSDLLSGAVPTATNLLGGVTSGLLGTATSTLGSTVGSTLNTLGSVTSGTTGLPVYIPTGIDASVSTTSSPTILPLGIPTNGLPTTTGLLDPVLNTVGGVLSTVSTTGSVSTNFDITSTTGLLAPVVNTLGNVLSALSVGSLPVDGNGIPLNLGSLPAGQLLNTVANVAESLPIIGAPSDGLTVPQVGVPVVPQPLLSTLVPTLLNTVSNLLSQPAPSVPAFNVDSNINQIIRKLYNLQGGYIEIQFDFRVASSLLPAGASLAVFLGNSPIYRVLASETGKRIVIPVPARLLKGQHSIGFLSVQGAVSSLFSFLISNLIVREKQIITQLVSGTVANGGFEVNGCVKNVCLSNAANALAGAAGWLAVPEMKIARSINLNPNFVNSWIVELDATANTCIVQNINLRQGRHFLRFDWAARVNSALSTNGILVILNRQLLKAIAPVDYAVHTEGLEFYISSNTATVELALCGAGKSDGVGSIVDNIDVLFENESVFRINVY